MRGLPTAELGPSALTLLLFSMYKRGNCQLFDFATTREWASRGSLLALSGRPQRL